MSGNRGLNLWQSLENSFHNAINQGLNFCHEFIDLFHYRFPVQIITVRMLYDIIIELVESPGKGLTHIISSSYIFLDITALLIIRRILG